MESSTPELGECAPEVELLDLNLRKVSLRELLSKGKTWSYYSNPRGSVWIERGC